MPHSFIHWSVHSFTEHLPDFGAVLGARTSSGRLIYKNGSGEQASDCTGGSSGLLEGRRGNCSSGGGRKDLPEVSALGCKGI